MLHVLLLEDAQFDIELIQTSLKNGGIECVLVCVETQEEFLEALKTTNFELILADYSLPAFDGFSALEIAKATCPDVPFILVSGVIGEESAIEALKQGATDYILKQRLGRLVPSVQRALKESRERRDRQRAEQILRQTDDMLRAVVNASPIAIITLHVDGRVMTWNPAAQEIYGWDAKEIIDRRLPLVSEDEQEIFERTFQRALHNETVNNLEIQQHHKKGAVVDISLSLAPVYDAQNQPYAVVMTAVDITTRKQIEAERISLLKREQTARANAEAASRLKDEFLAVLSHELRTPLNAILGWIRLLRKGHLDQATVNRALEVIDRNTTFQVQMIEDLLDLSRIIQGKLKWEIHPVNLLSVVEATAETLRPAAEAKSVKVQFVLDRNLGMIPGNANRLQQICWNLLSNAIKFTPKGGQVIVRLQKVDSYAQLQVADTGIGISADFLPHVFEYFRQADASTTRSTGGLGLGLAVSRYLVEMHGGTLEVTSPGEGQGATFTVMLPFRSAQMQIEPTPAPLDFTGELRGIKAIVIDDQTDSRELIAFVLEQQGAEVISAGSASEALEKLAQYKPDILITDISMPDEDGYTLLEKVRTLLQKQGANLPALAITAYARAEDQQQAISAGFQQHLAKPIDPSELVKAVLSLTLNVK
ncbi:hybrid sensor histidine kinase/response regulator [Nostoc sp. T09]|uniref:ATP-binding response regulator n=1 Tax=Nostoc sp. T09 TaxID=1932621 RepID=UPI000A3A4517|nr:hybrid sensor histidine kinase/response regulator [Nostoc sp. T09]OUL19226.1 hybrid sensor histidine kinase/response regulator [Nostoc sp. T09]